MNIDKKLTYKSVDATLPLEVKERLTEIQTLLVDLDGSLYPGPTQLEETLSLLSSSTQIIPITARSFGELETQGDFPGKITLVNSPFGIYESGFVIKRGKEITPLVSATRLQELTQIITRSIQTEGPRDASSKYILRRDKENPWAWGYLSTSLGEEYAERFFVPIIIPPYPDQFSLIIWPSGSAKECPSERFFYQAAVFLDGIRAAKPDIFENLSIVISNQSIIVRSTLNGLPVTKATAIQTLTTEGIINPRTCLFIGDEDVLDLEAAQFISQEGGLVIVPENADPKLKQISDFVAPGFAGNAILPILNQITQFSQRRNSS